MARNPNRKAMKLEEFALIANSKDNVATARVEIPAKMILEYEGDKIIVQSEIPFGHKLALAPIPKGGHVIKYGEPIGIATQNILPGEHVHSHNLEGKRGTGE